MTNAETPPQSPEYEQKPDGERWLELIGYGDMMDRPTGHYIDGVPVLARDFDKLCGDHAGPIFAALESINPSHPRYNDFIEAARKAFQSYFANAAQAE